VARPEHTRSQDPDFVKRCRFSALQERLPLQWPRPPDTPPSPKKSYRSRYRYLGWEDLQEGLDWAAVEDFDLLLQLVDFSPLRDVLALRLGWRSAKGKVPFDPVSLFLLTLWQIVNRWSRAQTLRNLRKPRYADYAERFGFREGIFPSEGRRSASLPDHFGQKLAGPGQPSLRSTSGSGHRSRHSAAQSAALAISSLDPGEWRAV
jgi:hypothetical protein